MQVEPVIPPFYVAKPAKDSLAARLRKHAMQVFIERQSAHLLGSDVLRQLLEWPEQYVNYEQFRAKGREMGKPCRTYFRWVPSRHSESKPTLT